MDTFLVILGVALLLVAGGLLDWRRRARLRGRFVAGRAGLSDERFLEEAGVPPENAELCLAIRGGFAEMCGLPAETIHPGDTLEDLSKFVFDNADILDITVFVGKHLKTRIPSRTVEEACLQVGGFRATLGAFAVALSGLLAKRECG
jgi:hypothetical protein